MAGHQLFKPTIPYAGEQGTISALQGMILARGVDQGFWPHLPQRALLKRARSTFNHECGVAFQFRAARGPLRRRIMDHPERPMAFDGNFKLNETYERGAARRLGLSRPG